MTTRSVIINGKYLSSGMTGVHRVATELVNGIDRLMSEAPASGRPSVRIVAPGSARSRPDLTTLPVSLEGHLTWQFWEQFELPLLARDAVLVGLCNLAPLAHPRAITMIHDAQVFLSPGSYSPAFRHWYQFALPRIGRRALRILTVSEYSKAQLVRFGVADAERIEVIHNGSDHILRTPADPDVVTRLGLTPGTFVVALANTQAHKNIKILFEAARRAAMSGIRLVLVGGATGQDFLDIGATPPPDTLFAGKVSDAELRGLLEAAGCLAFPSTTEGFGLPPLEAMQLGCPVVVAPEGALPEACGDAALYAGAQDPDAWAEAIATIISDGEQRRTQIAAGHRQAAGFTWDQASRKLMDCITMTLQTANETAG